MCTRALALLIAGLSAAEAFQLTPSTHRLTQGPASRAPMRVPATVTAVASPEVAPTTDEGAPAPEPSIPLTEAVYNLNKFVIDTVKGAIDVLYKDRDYARFYVLETVARVPYFAYLSVMHLRETFGAREADMRDRMRTHYAEADNELHHLLIMESLGGNESVIDRTFAQTMAFGYYWYVVAVYAWSEQAAYHLSELIEDHAYYTYDNFLTRKEDELKKLPVPDIARQYYEEGGFPFPDAMKMSGGGKKLESLYDVFVRVRDDEREHWQTLCSLVQYDRLPPGESAPLLSATQPVLEEAA